MTYGKKTLLRNIQRASRIRDLLQQSSTVGAYDRQSQEEIRDPGLLGEARTSCDHGCIQHLPPDTLSVEEAAQGGAGETRCAEGAVEDSCPQTAPCMAPGNPGGDQATQDDPSQPREGEAANTPGTVLPEECRSHSLSVHGGQAHQRSWRAENLPPEGQPLREAEESQPAESLEKTKGFQGNPSRSLRCTRYRREVHPRMQEVRHHLRGYLQSVRVRLEYDLPCLEGRGGVLRFLPDGLPSAVRKRPHGQRERVQEALRRAPEGTPLHALPHLPQDKDECPL